MPPQKTALLIGNSDGIGLKTTLKLLDQGFRVTGISKSPSGLSHSNYSHYIQNVRDKEYCSLLAGLEPVDLCIYFAGIGSLLDWNHLSNETRTFEVNLMAAVTTTEIVLTKMLRAGRGHFIGISSAADSITSAEAPSYSASKSGVSRFWEGLGLALKRQNKPVSVSNIRFGFVDTKMAKSPLKPFLLSTDQATEFILKVIERPKIRATTPKAIVPLVYLANLKNAVQLMVG